MYTFCEKQEARNLQLSPLAALFIASDAITQKQIQMFYFLVVLIVDEGEVFYDGNAGHVGVDQR